MSYSFNARGATVALALAAVAQKMNEVVAAQPAHAADRQLVLDTAERAAAVLAPLKEGEERDVSFQVNGFLQTATSHDESVNASSVQAVSLGVSASLVLREPKPAQA